MKNRLRNTNDADIPFTHLDIFKQSFFPCTLPLWNQLDLETRKSLSLSVFKKGIMLKPHKFEHFYHSCDRWADGLIHHSRIRIGCSKLKSHLFNNLHVTEEESCQCGHRSEDPFHFFFECPSYVALPNNFFTSVAQCSSFGMRFGYYAVLQLIIDVVIICESDVCHFSGSHSSETRTCIICELKVYF